MGTSSNCSPTQLNKDLLLRIFSSDTCDLVANSVAALRVNLEPWRDSKLCKQRNNKRPYCFCPRPYIFLNSAAHHIIKFSYYDSPCLTTMSSALRIFRCLCVYAILVLTV